MGHNNVFYGAIEEVSWRSLPDALIPRIQLANENAIAGCSDDARGYPPLCASMFHVTPAVATYRSRVFTFAGTFNGIASPETDERWLTRFEALLSRMYWERASVVGYPDVCRSQICVWTPPHRSWGGSDTDPEAPLPLPVSTWRRVLAPVPNSAAPPNPALQPTPPSRRG